MSHVCQNRSLLVVGSVAFDDVDGPFGLHANLLGGSASFIGTAASYFTDSTKLVAVVGEDFPRRYLDDFEKRNIDVSGIARLPGKTFHWKGRYADDLATRETLDTQLGVFAEFQPELSAHHRDADLVFLGNIDPTLQLQVLDQVERPSLVAIDTMNFWIARHRPELAQVLRRADIAIVNEEEARELAEEHNLVKAATKIKAMGPKGVVIKRGDAGAILFHQEGIFIAPALPLEEPKDPTGAGDSFAGGFMGYLAYARSVDAASVRTAMIYGSVLASFAVEQFSIDGIRDLKKEVIRERFVAFSRLGEFDRIAI